MPPANQPGDRYRQLIEMAPHAMVVVDRAGKIVLVNGQALAWFGYGRGELIGQPIEILVPERFRAGHPGLVAAYVQSPVLRPLGTGRDLSARRKDGTEIPVDISLSPVETEHGLQVLASIADMTEHKRTESALHRANLALGQVNAELEQAQARLVAEAAERTRTEQRYRQLVEMAPHAMVIVDSAGTIVLVNSRVLAWYGYEREALLGQPIDTLIPERFRRSHAQHVRSFVDAPARRAMGTGLELYTRRKDGSEFPVDISLGYLETEDGLQVIASIADLSERKRFDETLNRAREVEALNQELQAFAYSVSHDLRAPLRAMVAFASILRQEHGANLNAEGKDYLRRIEAAGAHMGQLIDGMLTLSRIARSPLSLAPVDLSALVREILGELQASQPDRPVRTQVEPCCTVRADPRLLRILLTNLLGNAWKFSGKAAQPAIAFGAAQTGHGRAFYVRDNGAGFDMAYASKLFSAFERLHDADEFPGTGIGLATAQRVVNRHGGRIWAQAEVGKGATFYFIL